MDFYLHKDMLGSAKHLVCTDNGIVSSTDEPEGLTRIDSKTFKDISKVYNLVCPSWPPEAVLRSVNAVMGEEASGLVPWKFCMPKESYQDSVKEYATKMSNILLPLEPKYIEETYAKHDSLFEGFRRAKINRGIWARHMLVAEGASRTLLKSFEPRDDGYAEPVVYNRTKGVTGRLTVESGPNILNLLTTHRNVIQSRFGDDGKILYMDYASLEPRCLLATNQLRRDFLSSMGSVPLDLYSSMITDLRLPAEITRDFVKLAVISLLYGAKRETMIYKLTDKIAYPEDFVSAVESYYNITKLREVLNDEYVENGGESIRNFYERPIHSTNTTARTLVNYYIQSTAVDVALHGFSQIVDKITTSGAGHLMVPLFILHDALILDIHKDVVHLMTKLASVGQKIPGLENSTFFIEVSEL